MTNMDVPRKKITASPADNPKTMSSPLFKEYSIDLAVKILVQKIMVRGLEIINIKVDINFLLNLVNY